MKLKIEAMEGMIWIFVIVPLFALIFFMFGTEVGLLSLIMLPIALVLKNAFLKRSFSWKPAYSVGVNIFDEDHRKLFDLMLQMHSALNRMPGKEEARAVLEELKKYTITHFGREEALMKKYAYPGLDAHRKEHEEMKCKLEEFLEQFEKDNVTVSKKVLRYLQDWLIKHIQVTDKQYSDFFNSKGER
ncbi:bacteriohemerythrin [Candidatus Halobeggiatoa sp. HSG11]|nr:bacteriohemerythrin [Candidatus Halobeggiatoa sp. HSG11]